jgi:hypothetical protein
VRLAIHGLGIDQEKIGATPKDCADLRIQIVPDTANSDFHGIDLLV